MTDANVVLGRIIPCYFPQIFGTTEDRPIDVVASKRAFEDLTNEVQIHIFYVPYFRTSGHYNV